MEELVLVPGARWRVEEAIKLAKSSAGMADYEVRSFHGWYRHITLANWPQRSWPLRPPPHANRQFPGSAGHRGKEGDSRSPTTLDDTAPIAYTAYEVCRLLEVMAPQPVPKARIRHGLHWSRWRRCHQALARACHRRRNQSRPAVPGTPALAEYLIGKRRVFVLRCGQLQLWYP
ncbi:hypothetical protein ABZV34_35595 [Streptomyces sp. NPDC005195]|uniref:hypothetical protein n=1 Tax=Streptomyces sp. NPDC005195 TaxID=3154561 RepID=UPI0033A90D4A